MFKKKIGIITITSGYNYGNRLQNLAMEVLLRTRFDTVETINNKLTTNRNIKYELSKIKKYIRILIKGKSLDAVAFESFNQKYISFSKYTLFKNNDKKKLDEYYDGYVIGSDQIWNPNYEENDLRGYAWIW